MTLTLAEKRKRRFTDFAEELPPLDGDKIKLDTVLNQEIEVIGCRIGATRYSKNKSGKYLMLQIVWRNQHYVLFTGSDILIRQVEQYADQIPFLTTIMKINKYYTLS